MIPALLMVLLAATAHAGDVVKVIARGCPGRGDAVLSGFAVGTGAQVITALHGVVGDSCRVVVRRDSGSEVAVKVQRVDQANDLALLVGRDAPVALTPFATIGTLTSTQAGGHFRVRGYPLNVANMLETRLRVRGAQLVELRTLLPPLERVQLDNRKSPSLTSKVLSLQGSLTPGYSGAPILADDGVVVGVANGGLAAGTTEITWAVDGGAVARLRDGTVDDVATVFATLQSAGSGPLFTVVYEDQPHPGFGCFGRKFVFLRRVGLEELGRDADDRSTLTGITAVYNVEGLDSTFDIFASDDGEIRLVVPTNWAVQTEGYAKCWIRPDDEGSTLRAYYTWHPLESGPFATEVQQAAIETENELCEDGFDVNLSVGYPEPRVNHLTGVMSRRRHYFRDDVRCGPQNASPDIIGTSFWYNLPKPLAHPLANAVESKCGRWICPNLSVLLPSFWNSPYLTGPQREQIARLNTGDAFTSLTATRSFLLVGVARDERSPDATLRFHRCKRDMDRSTECVATVDRFVDFATATIALTSSTLRADPVVD